MMRCIVFLRYITIAFLLFATVAYLNLARKKEDIYDVVFGLVASFFMASAICFLWG